MKDRVNIAFQGGTHGNFLRYCIDKFCKHTPDIIGTPFTKNNTSHIDLNYSDLVYRYHPKTFEPFYENENEPHILITIEKEDLLYLERWVTMRAGDHKVDASKNVVQPHTEFLKDFRWEHNFKKYYNLDLAQSTVPKFLMRDFYKLSFLDPDKNGFIELDTKLRNNLPKKTFCFPVSSFWDKTKFFMTMKQADEYLQLNLDISDENVFDEFATGLNFIDTKDRALDVIKAIDENRDLDIKDLDVVEQAFISAWLEKKFEYIVVPVCNQFFHSTSEILEWLKHYPQHYKAMNPNLPTFNNIPNPFHLWKSEK